MECTKKRAGNSFSIVFTVALLLLMIVAMIPGVMGAGPESPVNLLSAGHFVILAKTTITDVPASAITGDVGVSPAAGSAMLVPCSEVTGTIYLVDPSGPDSACGTPDSTLLHQAILDMGTAYGDAAGRTIPDATELFSGHLGGHTITPGLYKWGTDVDITTDVTLDGQNNPNAVWIFQISGDLGIASGASVPAGIKVNLINGANSSKIFWQVGGPTGATLGTYSTFNGNILSAKQVFLQTGAVLNGRAFADSQVILQMNTVNIPTASAGPVANFIYNPVNGTAGGTSIVEVYEVP